MNWLKKFIAILFWISVVKCDFEKVVYNRVRQVIKRGTETYGNVSGNVYSKSQEDRLTYPRGDLHKLAAIWAAWRAHYACQTRQLSRATRSGSQTGVIVSVYSGSVARLPCQLCAAPGEEDYLWVYAKSFKNLTFSYLIEKENIVIEDNGNLTIYHVEFEDAGAYRCKVEDSYGPLVLLEVIDDDNYKVVKPPSSHGPFASPPFKISSDMILFSNWSPWSECSVCGHVGRRRRYGLCYVGPVDDELDDENYDEMEGNSTKIDLALCDNETVMFEAFPHGIPCASPLLPKIIADLPAVKNRGNEIMIGLCKEECNYNVIFEVRTKNGVLIERANNSAGIYSLLQPLPQQMPAPGKDIVFGTWGKPLVIQCPGTTLHDIPVSWRVGIQKVVPRDLDISSTGRVYLNARDRLVFKTVQHIDANMYRCWERNYLAGSVKAAVWLGGGAAWSSHVLLAGLAGAAACLLRAVDNMATKKTFQLGY